MESRFFYSGLAVFDNLEHYEDQEPVETGAQFHIENLFYGRDIGMDMLDITAIAIVRGSPEVLRE